MAKNLKLHVKNVQIADAINLRGLKAKLSKKKPEEEASPELAAPEAEEQVGAEKKKRTTKAKVKPSEEASSPVVKSDAPKETTKPVTVPVEAVKKEPVPEVVQAAPKAEAAVAPKESKPVPEVAKPKAEVPEAPKEKPLPLGPVMRSVPTPPTSTTPTQAQPPKPMLGPVHRTERPHGSAPSQHKGPWRDVSQERLGPVERHPHAQQPRPPYQGGPGGPGGYQGGPRRDHPGRDYQGREYQSRDNSGREQSGGGYNTGGPRPPYQGGQRPPYQGGQRPPYQGGQRPPYQGGQPRPPYQGGQRPPYQGGQPRFGGGPQDARRMQPFARGPASGPQPTLPRDPTKAQDRGVRHVEKKEPGARDDDAFGRAKGKQKDIREPSKPIKRGDGKDFDVRLRQGLPGGEEEDQVWRKKRPSKMFRTVQEQEVIRPSKILVRLPISVKDLAAEMKLKASQLISKLFLQGTVVTLNDLLDNDTVVQLLGHEFGCEIQIDTREQERIQITGKTIDEEIAESDQDKVVTRPPVVAFMGHVDHGKTSLIDAIRSSNRVQHEVGAITQHIGAFRCTTSQGDITILDTPGHEAFSHMRERGAEVTDIVVLVVAGDEGMKEQTFEALEQALNSKATIVVALNKCDKPGFNAENVYRQLADKNLLPEVWGGQTITVNCSAVTNEGIPELLEMLALQAEVLELRANPSMRARGSVIESQVDKGLGNVATVLVQNGTLNIGDSLVFGFDWARVKTMRDQDGREVQSAPPSMPVRINGLSGLPESGEEFIVVKSEREAREISAARQEGRRQTGFLAKKRLTFEGMVEKATDVIIKKVLTLILRADVQGSLEALKIGIEKITSAKVEANIISTGVGLITESDVQLAQASKAVIIGFHTQVESHVEPTVKELGVQVRLHEIIYHAIDDVKDLMRTLLDKIKQEKDAGRAEVKATFKSSHLGLIAGCQVADGTILRNHHIRVMRQGTEIWKGPIASLKRVKEDVREVSKGMECGILLQGFSDFQQGDILQAFEVIYLSQDI